MWALLDVDELGVHAIVWPPVLLSPVPAQLAARQLPHVKMYLTECKRFCCFLLTTTFSILRNLNEIFDACE